MSTLDTIPITDILTQAAAAVTDGQARAVAARIVWRVFAAHRDDPIPGIPWPFPFLRRPRIGQLKAVLVQLFGAEPDDAPSAA